VSAAVRSVDRSGVEGVLFTADASTCQAVDTESGLALPEVLLCGDFLRVKAVGRAPNTLMRRLW
jgi:hypothetical protein